MAKVFRNNVFVREFETNELALQYAETLRAVASGDVIVVDETLI